MLIPYSTRRPGDLIRKETELAQKEWLFPEPCGSLTSTAAAGSRPASLVLPGDLTTEKLEVTRNSDLTRFLWVRRQGVT